MLILVIDTSLQGIVIGLARQSGKTYKILEIYGSNLPQEATARLPELCQSVLDKQNARLEDIGALVVSHGPGSFTGIKIGLSFAAGWKRAGTAIKVYGVSSFKALLGQYPDAGSLLLPATQTAGYLVLKSPSTEGQPQLGVIDLTAAAGSVIALVDDSGANLQKLAAQGLAPAMLLGPWPKLETWLGDQQIAIATVDTARLYQAVVKGMVEEFIAKSDQLSEGELRPIYLRKSAPEEKLDNLAKVLP